MFDLLVVRLMLRNVFWVVRQHWLETCKTFLVSLLYGHVLSFLQLALPQFCSLDMLVVQAERAERSEASEAADGHK